MPRTSIHYLMALLTLTAVLSCARMGQPDGGWYDQLPPRILSTTPPESSINATSKRIIITFDEYIKIDNPQQNVVISPPQREEPTIKVQGRRLTVELKDTLRQNTTYTIDFADAIKDLNEGNPMGSYTYTFATGPSIDTLQVSGYVLDACTLEPVSGITVGLCHTDADSMIRVARTDNNGHFVIKGVAEEAYHIMALNDIDGDLRYSQQAEQVAFSHSAFTPSVTMAYRQDTVWTDSLHIKTIARTQYNRYLPDDIVLRAFTAAPTNRMLLRSERQDNEKFTLFFSAPDTIPPQIRGIGFGQEGLIVEPSEGNDTLTCWIADSMLIRQDTLGLELSYRSTDTLGMLTSQTDTIRIVARKPYAQKQKELEREYDKWQQQQRRKQQRGEPTEQLPPTAFIQPKYNTPSVIMPDEDPTIQLATPLLNINRQAIRLYMHRDTARQKVEHHLVPAADHTYRIQAQWQPGAMYSLEVDSAAITDIFNRVNHAYKAQIKVADEDEYGTLEVAISGSTEGNIIVQLTTENGTVLKQTHAVGQTAHFDYVRTGTYYLRAYNDENHNHKWDTGDYNKQRQPEAVYYNPRPVAARAKWDVKQTWNLTETPLFMQKPHRTAVTARQESKSTFQLNQQRASKMGIKEIPQKVTGNQAAATQP